ncbi:biotin--[acetyl-CoA-carboxylase] ligase [Blattabacterium sp. (Blaberus giganteus)]|uniref:biotin--[acetyl-CoA-carboxylase] ligase n=1 Tax=Blattabacterium sp. (Blaberus giganteus) TaxID=1186051 RepID=UPI00025F6F9C|nr:biotin--[acetyl-CoA-carboxylase] ligase [Blattabacterium sp. (Blaberus giganteus)]AFJ90844.1 biotin/lipoate A/B protein ligase [Blattabacterium sp. (Blaberus giganteus)]
MKKFIWPINLIILKKIDSTNQYAKKYIYEKYNWVIIWTMNQTKGIGMNKNSWYTEKKKNLTFSIVLKPIITLYIKKIYIINIVISNAVHKILSKYYNKKNKEKIWIKWPNDIVINNKKVGGILIENSVFSKKIHTIIIGIGLNINQTQFKKEWNASSIKEIFNLNLDLDYIFYNIIYFIQKEYLFFIIHGEQFIRKYYINHLYLKDQVSIFYIYKTNNYILGIIRSISNQGFLVIESNEKFYFFSHKEIKFVIT